MKEVETVLKSFEEDTLPDSIYVDTLKVVEELRKEDEKIYPIPAMYFKNTASQRKINTKLRSLEP